MDLLVFGLLAAALACAMRYLVAARHDVGSVDFFYYVCTARDMLAPDVTVSDRCYSYFPGVYAFWRSVMRWLGSGLPDLQRGYVLLIVTNAALVGAVIGRLTGHLLLGLFGALWYLVLVSRFEGLAGVSEPLATAAFLCGLLMWAGQPLRGRRGIVCTLWLGMSLGLTVYAKQQAGLLTLGAVSLLLPQWGDQRAARHSWVFLCLLPLVALLVFLAGILWEGRGWVPLREGLSFAAGYGRESNLLRNLYVQIRGDELAALAAGLMVLTWCLLIWKGDRGELAQSRPFQVASWSVFAFLFALVQFASRPFGHYMLLGIPCLVVGSVLQGHLLWVRFIRHGNSSAGHGLLLRVLVLMAAALPLCSLSGRTDTLLVWRWTLPEGFCANQLWHRQAAVEHDIGQLHEAVATGSTMYILPPRRNSIYFLLGTHTASPDGYTFFETDLQRFPWRDCRYFILLTGGLNEFDYQFSSRQRVEEVRQLLRTKGFAAPPDLTLEAMEFYAQW